MQEVGENYRKMGDSSEANERIVQMMQEVCNRNEDMLEEQREFFRKLLSAVDEENSGEEKENSDIVE